METAYRKMCRKTLPEGLKINPILTVQRLGPKSYAVVSDEGAFEISSSILATLRLFNGKRSKNEVLHEADMRWGLSLKPNIVSTFYQHGLVVDANIK